MVLDRNVGIMLTMMKKSKTPIYKMDIDSARSLLKTKYSKKIGIELVGTSADYSVDTNNGPITVRVYHPIQLKKPGLCYIYYHGGGGVLLSIEEYDSVCRHLCNTSGACVVSVDYHLAPEYKYPVQIEDSLSAYNWVLNNQKMLSIDQNKIVVIGDSFGGYLATEVCLELRNNKTTPPYAQILLYPRTDYQRLDTESYKLYSCGYNLDSEEMKWHWNAFLPADQSHDDPRVCPNRSKDLSGLPLTYVYTAEYDPLRDEGEEYANKILNNNNVVFLTRVRGQIHGFIQLWEQLETSRNILEEISTLPDMTQIDIRDRLTKTDKNSNKQ